LVDNGGWLDNVIWVVNTENTEDINFLNTIIAQSSRYKKVVLEKVVWWPEFTHIWRMVERGTLYIKIDDDVVRGFALCQLQKGCIADRCRAACRSGSPTMPSQGLLQPSLSTQKRLQCLQM
jgi:hypothetical protein